jgi:3'(2'), 5'-bisphosphate nucleotidase
MVGLLQESQPIAGWVYAPTSDRLYYGGSGWGLFQAIDNQPSVVIPSIEPSAPTHDWCPIVIGHRDEARFGAAIQRAIPAAQFYSLGSFGLKVMEVVLGRAGIYIYFNGRVKVWDTAGPVAIAKSAGLVCCDLEGRSLSFSASDIHAETLAHKQPIVIGWPHYVEQLLPKFKQAVQNVLQE